jgi:hypothetical protein
MIMTVFIPPEQKDLLNTMHQEPPSRCRKRTMMASTENTSGKKLRR